MKDFFRDILKYHHHFNQELLIQLIENENQLEIEIQQLMSHSILAQEIWNSRVTKSTVEAVNTFYRLQECKTLNDKNHSEALSILNDFDLDMNIAYSNSKGQHFNNTLIEIFYHVTNHFTHHRAQIISSLKNKGITPIATDYIFYKRK
ncbi:hypothetical protein GCM10009117_20240 [Gangjinia marincola]|uniref:Damage-inducible protein DinB n=1 Tax=Gangjinia marincola TaxID=578463 RepID=A0ABN1MIX2_9FLAO